MRERSCRHWNKLQIMTPPSAPDSRNSVFARQTDSMYVSSLRLRAESIPLYIVRASPAILPAKPAINFGSEGTANAT